MTPMTLVEFDGAYAWPRSQVVPLGAYTLLGFPLNELGSTVHRLDDVFGVDGHRLSEQLRDAPGWEVASP